jgi:hypothetical protein
VKAASIPSCGNDRSVGSNNVMGMALSAGREGTCKSDLSPPAVAATSGGGASPPLCGRGHQWQRKVPLPSASRGLELYPMAGPSAPSSSIQLSTVWDLWKSLRLLMWSNRECTNSCSSI